MPEDLTNVVALAAYWSHAIALREDGCISIWGDNRDGALEVPANLPPLASVTANYAMSGGIARDGEMFGWGDYFGMFGPVFANCSPEARRTMVSLNTNFERVQALRSDGIAGVLSECDLRTDGQKSPITSVFAYHGHAYGLTPEGEALLLYTRTTWPELVPPPGISNVISLGIGYGHVIALRRDGTVLGWGGNAGGQLNVPTEATNVVQVAASANVSLALREDGTVLAWGDNLSGPGHLDIPPGLSNVVSLTVHGAGVLALVMDPTSPKIYHPPRGASIMSQTPFLMRVEAVGTPRLRYQWRKDGTDVPGATNDFFYLPLAQATDSGDYTVAVGNHLGTNVSAMAQLIVTDTSPLITQTPTNALHSTYGSPVTFSVGATGSPPLFYQWQFNGEDIPDATNSVYTVNSPRFANEGEYRVRVWNTYGEEFTDAVPLTLLDVVVVNYGGPPFPRSFSNAVDLSVSQNHVLALRADGQVVSWRLAGDDPAAVPPAGISNVVAISSGERHYLALRRDGYLYAWGDNTYGQVSGIHGLTGIISIASGFDYNLALSADGLVLGAGGNSHGQLFPQGTMFPGAMAVASGNSSRTSYVILGDGSVMASGQDHYGLIASAGTLHNSVALSGSIFHAAALSGDGSVIVFGNTASTTSPVAPSSATNLVHLVCVGAISPGGFFLSDSSAFIAIRADGTCITWGFALPIPEDLRQFSVRAAGLSYQQPVLLLDRAATSRWLITERTSDNQLQLRMPTTHRRNYLLQARDSLTEGEWTEVQTLPGNGQVRFFDPQVIGSGERYFRLELQETFGLSP